jgi:phenylalanyl-tRNA synthetase alpha chain
MLDPTQLTGKQRQLVQLLQTHTQIPSLRSLCQQHDLDFNFAKGFLLSGLLDQDLQLQELTEEVWELTARGQSLNGAVPGFRLSQKLAQGQTEAQALQQELGEAFSLEFGALRREEAVDMMATDTTKTIAVLDPTLFERFKARQTVFEAIDREQLQVEDEVSLSWLVQQGLIVKKQTQDYQIGVNPTIQSIVLESSITALTGDLLISGQWRQVDLKPYNIHDDVPDVIYGRPSILTQCIQRIRTIFIEMGFDEMSGYLVESTFWNFDALFTPQDHPAREIQDTFYLADPRELPLPDDPDLVQRVKQVHEQNYNGTWTQAEASRAIFRAHTTTSTARKLYQLQGKTGKYFSIDKVFRNETLDRTHLAEFHQIEGVVIGELLSVRTLMGYLSYFYQQLGFQHLKFKPTYNPYTEPSLEVYAYHLPSQKYLEVGNSGLFRPEMLEPLGCGKRWTIAWGLGLERIAMLLYDVEKLSDLVGPDIRLNA